MVAVAPSKVGRIARMWPGRARQIPGMPRTGHLDARTDPLPLRPLTAAELIAMARAARRSEREISSAQT
jgi:hypothetical protein